MSRRSIERRSAVRGRKNDGRWPLPVTIRYDGDPRRWAGVKKLE